MNRTFPLTGFAWALCVLCACDDRISGNTTQTENTVAARSILVDSILPDWNRPKKDSVTVATLRMNASNFDFTESDSAGRDLAVLKENGDSIPFEVVYWDRQARLGRLEVRIDWTLRVQHARFELKWRQPTRSRSNPTEVWTNISDSQKLAIGSVLVADFENGTDTTLLPTHPVWTTSAATDSSSVSSIAFLPAGGKRTGTVLSMSYKSLGSKAVVIKTALVVDDGARNLRSLDSLVFWAKGTNKSGLFSAFEHASDFKAWKLDTLDTAWKRIRIRPSDFIPASNPNGGNRGWAAVRDSVTDLTFIVNNGTSIQLDDIRLYGINRDDLK